MLREIFEKLDLHAGKFDTYFDVYEQHFSKFVGKKPVVVEVGIYKGGSAKMWKEYFGPGATIIGIDVNEELCSQYTTPGCEQVFGDQGKIEFWQKFFETHPDIDVFIDDGGHHQFQQINTLYSVWPHMNQGGVYLCEDTHTSYWPDYSGGGLKKPTSFIEYAKIVSDVVNSDHWRDGDKNQDNQLLADYYKDVSGMHFYDSIVVLDKNPKIKATLLLSTPA
jgi:hypothetical protein